MHTGFVGMLVVLIEPFTGSNPENALIGLIGMSFMVTYTLAAPIFGFLRVNRWWVIAGGVAVWSLACGASGLASSFEILLITRCLVGNW